MTCSFPFLIATFTASVCQQGSGSCGCFEASCGWRQLVDVATAGMSRLFKHLSYEADNERKEESKAGDHMLILCEATSDCLKSYAFFYSSR